MSGLSTRDIGHRVVVRHRLDDGRATDVIGVLEASTEQRLEVRHADGTPYRIALGAVLAAKPVPPMPLRPLDVEQLFRTTALGRPAVETQAVGDWLLRASGGWTGRGNSLLPAGEPGMPLEEALALVRAFYAERELPALALVRLGSTAEDGLRGHGWVEAQPGRADVQVMHTTLDQVNGVPAYAVEVTGEPGADWYAAAFEGPAPAAASSVLEGAPRAVFASVVLDGRTVAVGRGSMTGHWVGVDTVRVDPAYRRRGLGTAVLQGIARWAGPLGGRRSYLEVIEDNEAAMATYARLGFATAYRYRYLTAGGGR